MGTTVGAAVGFQIRFTDRTGPDTRLKVMTDGILLRELEHDRQLRNYDTLIIDEAHERSLNIDFLLGVLKRVLPQRPELRVIIPPPRSIPNASRTSSAARRSSRCPAAAIRSTRATVR
jgi:ATP-dependent helicase HrpA